MYMMTLFDTLVAIQDEDDDEYEDGFVYVCQMKQEREICYYSPGNIPKSNITDWQQHMLPHY